MKIYNNPSGLLNETSSESFFSMFFFYIYIYIYIYIFCLYIIMKESKRESLKLFLRKIESKI